MSIKNRFLIFDQMEAEDIDCLVQIDILTSVRDEKTDDELQETSIDPSSPSTHSIF